MGSCLCNNKSVEEVIPNPQMSNSDRSISEDTIALALQLSGNTMIAEYILEMLAEMSKSSQPIDEIPLSQIGLNLIAEKPEGWEKVFEKLVDTIPMSEPLGPSTIAIIFDQCPLPAAKTVLGALEKFKLGCLRARSCHKLSGNQSYERNMLLLLGCIAEKYAGEVSTMLLTPNVVEYICTFLLDRRAPELVIQSLVAIEKFAKTTENRQVFGEYFQKQEEKNSLIELECYSSADHLWRQVRFCARWLLDNHFIVPGRPLSYTTVDMSDKNAILNTKKSTECLKIGSDGLGARCDSHTFESARCTFMVTEGCWYYEAEILTAGVMQIGWATDKTRISPGEGYGVGDDCFSLGYDGCRRLLWHKAEPEECEGVEPWAPGDIVGCLIDIGRREAIFSVNGRRLPICTEIFDMENEGFYAAASLMCFQGAQFNFGADEFRYAPADREFMIFNDHGLLTEEEKQVIPRWLIQERVQAAALKKKDEEENLCTICYDRQPEVFISPCLHKDFCRECAHRLLECPLCRGVVWHYTVMPL